jgi:lysozyme
MKKGIDVSWAQGKIDWSKVKTDFAILKCNTGVNAWDAQLAANAKGAHEFCIPFGYYHWVTLNKVDVVSDAKAEASDFIKAMNTYTGATILPALDIEEDNKLKLSPNQILLWIETFEAELKQAGFGLMIYSYKPWLDTNLPKDHKLGRIPLWIAQYPNKWTEQSKPILPFGWSDYYIWQYSAKGRIDGINTDVDLNVMNN